MHGRKRRRPRPARRRKVVGSAGFPVAAARAGGGVFDFVGREHPRGQNFESAVADHADDLVRQAAAHRFFAQHEHREALIVDVGRELARRAA